MMKESKIMISMIVPLYKGKCYLNRIIKMYSENVRHLKNRIGCLETELVLVNDCPNEKIILLHSELKNLNVILVQNQKNIGIHRSKIEGLKAARGKYIFFLDQDDLISPYYFVDQYKLIGDCDAVICNMVLDEGPHYLKQGVEALDIERYLKGYNAISSLGQVLIKRDCVPQEWIEYPLSVNGADDYYLIFIMLLKKRRMIEHRKILYYHVYTGNNFSFDFRAMCLSVIEIFRHTRRMGLITRKQAETAIKNRQKGINELKKTEEKYPINIRQERQDNIRLINLYDKCLKNLEANYKIDNYIKTFQCSRVAVYGAGKMGRHFVYWMQNADVKIVILIDKVKRGEINGIPIVDLCEAQEQSGAFDMIIVTPMVETKDIITDLQGLFVCPVISLETVIYNMSSQLLETAHKTETARYIVN